MFLLLRRTSCLCPSDLFLGTESQALAGLAERRGLGLEERCGLGLKERRGLGLEERREAWPGAGTPGSLWGRGAGGVGGASSEDGKL